MSKRQIEVLIGSLVIVTVVLSLLVASYLNNLNKEKSFYVSVYESTVPTLHVPGVENLKLTVRNNTDRKYKSLTVSTTCFTTYDTIAYGEKKFLDITAYENFSSSIKINMYNSYGDISSCYTDYDIEDYNIIEWIAHYFN